MRVAVFGANGKVGRLIVQKLIEDNYEVTAFVHNSSSFTETKNLKIAQGDVHRLSDVKSAVKDSEIIVSALGSWGTKQKDIVSSGTKNIIEASKGTNIRRVITLTGSDALAKGDKTGLFNRAVHSLIKLSPARRILIDGEQHISMLEMSNLNWTVLRSPVMNNHGNSSSYSLNNVRPKPWQTVNRLSVADAMVKLINDSKSLTKALYINRA